MSREMKIGVVGAGAVGKRVLRQVPSAKYIPSPPYSQAYSQALPDLDLVVLANDSAEQSILAGMAVAEGVSVLATADKPNVVSALFKLDILAKERGVTVLAGAAYSPGLSCLLAAHLASRLDKLTEIHIARMGTGGPACARNYHRALSGMASEYYEGSWRRRPGGSGRELYWFPEPLGGADCYAGALPEPLLLARSFGHARRITAKRAATRQDRFTAPFPMMSPPRSEGGLGGVRVDVRGIQGGEFTELTAASVALPAMAAASVLITLISWIKAANDPISDRKISDRKSASGVVDAAGGTAGFSAGVMGLSEAISTPKEFLHELAQQGIGIYEFVGSAS